MSTTDSMSSDESDDSSSMEATNSQTQKFYYVVNIPRPTRAMSEKMALKRQTEPFNYHGEFRWISDDQSGFEFYLYDYDYMYERKESPNTKCMDKFGFSSWELAKTDKLLTKEEDEKRKYDFKVTYVSSHIDQIQALLDDVQSIKSIKEVKPLVDSLREKFTSSAQLSMISTTSQDLLIEKISEAAKRLGYFVEDSRWKYAHNKNLSRFHSKNFDDLALLAIFSSYSYCGFAVMCMQDGANVCNLLECMEKVAGEVIYQHLKKCSVKIISDIQIYGLIIDSDIQTSNIYYLNMDFCKGYSQLKEGIEPIAVEEAASRLIATMRKTISHP